jgi:hypothetical protein
MSEYLGPRIGENTKPYLYDGSGCESCNFTGRFGGWIGQRYRAYPQIKCSHCAPSKAKRIETTP